MDLQLVLKRDPSNAVSTLGSLTINGVFECFTLEDIVRPVKVKGKTAIPKGTYKVIITKSPRFGVMMPLLLGVPGFDGVRIHWGNTSEDTEGCILVGQTKGETTIGSSRLAYAKLMEKLLKATSITLRID